MGKTPKINSVLAPPLIYANQQERSGGKSGLISSTSNSLLIGINCDNFYQTFDLIQYYKFLLHQGSDSSLPNNVTLLRICKGDQSFLVRLNFKNYTFSANFQLMLIPIFSVCAPPPVTLLITLIHITIKYKWLKLRIYHHVKLKKKFNLLFKELDIT